MQVSGGGQGTRRHPLAPRRTVGVEVSGDLISNGAQSLSPESGHINIYCHIQRE